ncbi:hypothetical protein OSTOST_12440, partial [Ostertagia ostertagi]
MEVVKMLTPQNMFYIVVAKKYTGQEGHVLEPMYDCYHHSVVHSSPKSTMLSLMYRSCLVDALTEDISNASLAGLYCDITNTHSGLVLE